MSTTTITATSSTNIYQQLFTAYVDWSSALFIALPFGILVWSCNKSQSYYQDNETFYKTIQDSIDRNTFGKVIIPLFKHINSSLTTDLVSKSKLPTISGNQNIIEESDKAKVELLKNYDFSYLEEAIEFQDSIEKIIKTKKDQTSFKLAVKRSRWFIVATTLSSAVNLILGFILVGSQAIFGFDSQIVISSFILWVISLAVCLICALCFYSFRIKIEEMRYE